MWRAPHDARGSPTRPPPLLRAPGPREGRRKRPPAGASSHRAPDRRLPYRRKDRFRPKMVGPRDPRTIHAGAPREVGTRPKSGVVAPAIVCRAHRASDPFGLDASWPCLSTDRITALIRSQKISGMSPGFGSKARAIMVRVQCIISLGGHAVA